MTDPFSEMMNKSPEFKAWQHQNPYFGKYFSILGDSISTMEGCNPPEYKLYYTADDGRGTGVIAAEQTWWGLVLACLGGTLLVNNSWSGSRVTRLPLSKELFPSGCSDERTSELHKGPIQPDVILIHMGTNDWGFGVPVDSGMLYEFEQPDEAVFCIAYPLMLQKLRAQYPQTEICCFTIPPSHMSSRPDFVFPQKLYGVDVERFNNVIRQTAEANGCRILDLYQEQTPYDTIDGTHPNVSGMRTLAALVLRTLCGSEGARFLEGLSAD